MADRDALTVDAVSAALEVAERLMYGWDNDAGKYGLWDPETNKFLIHVPKAATNLRPYRAEIIAGLLCEAGVAS